jgi:hypothetical protein
MTSVSRRAFVGMTIAGAALAAEANVYATDLPCVPQKSRPVQLAAPRTRSALLRSCAIGCLT